MIVSFKYGIMQFLKVLMNRIFIGIILPGFFFFFFFEVSGSQSVPFGPEVSTPPGKLLEMQLLGPHL